MQKGAMYGDANEVVDIISKNFLNGVRDDFINVSKIQRIYWNDYSEKNISRDFVITVIRSRGVKIGEKFYFISENEIKETCAFAYEILKKNPLAYYSILYKKHANFFSKFYIFSDEMLKKILQNHSKKFFCFDEFCSKERTTRLTYEISKVFMESRKSLSSEYLEKLFPYVPAEKILAELSTKKFLSTVSKKYFAVSMLKFNYSEIDAVKKKISDTIREKEYATFEDFDLSLNFMINPEINEQVLIALIYKKFFADKFIMRGKKFFTKGIKSKKPAKGTLEKIFNARNEITYSEILNYYRKVGVSSSNIFALALKYGFQFMVRVDENLFVKDSLIKFDVEKIDDALKSFVQGKIVPLRSVTSFTGFPSIGGYSWNLFLLESFLRKYSKKYTYNAPTMSSANVGAIYPSSMKFENYIDVQAAIVVQENILPENSAVEKFLIENGYRTKRIAGITDKIIARAQAL